jgi:hypothetical protein
MTDLTTAKAILAQLGGERFLMMTGATTFIGSADSLTFKLGSNLKRVTHVRVTLTPDGLYDMTFFRTGKGPQSHDGVHREMLQEVLALTPGSIRPFKHQLRAASSGATGRRGLGSIHDDGASVVQSA